MIVNIQDDILKLFSMGLLDELLVDKATKQNILWATNAYEDLGELYAPDREVISALFTGTNSHLIKTRARKAMEQQAERTKKRGEVFTPLWICKKMCGYADEEWEGKNDWKKYVDRRVLEITCGEAPFLVSRYDVETGEAIPVNERIGLLDRKLQMVSQNTSTEEEWLTWTFRAFQSTYGYEYQGDNLLIARVNLAMTFEEHLQEAWGRKPTPKEFKQAIHIISWNVWQMDGLTGAVPNGALGESDGQTTLFELLGLEPSKKEKTMCRVYNWRGQHSYPYQSLPVGGKNPMKFDFVIGNPPYQDETVGEQKTFAPPIYHLFLDEAYKVADKVEMIHPARFLFNAGSTPKAWNQKMLQDKHLKVEFYEPLSAKVFPNTDIKGGVAITYRSETEDFGAIDTFTAFPELNTIMKKVTQISDFSSFAKIVVTRTAYRLTDKMHQDHPEAIGQLSKGHPYDMSTNIFDLLPQIFFEEKPKDGNAYIQIYGRTGTERNYKFVQADFVNRPDNLYKWKIFVPAANGSGALGEVLTTPVIGQPVIGHTETFISVGAFQTEEEARACLKYIKTKFCRLLLGILKITQHNPPEKWRFVPLQDFTDQSDLDWTGSVKSVDAQLYKKYGLDENEIAFIESHVKEME